MTEAYGANRAAPDPHSAGIHALQEPTLTMPRVGLGPAASPQAAKPSHQALRERLQGAALLVRNNRPREALAEFEAVYANYLTLGDPALAVVGAKAAFNRAVLLEKMLGDPQRAEAAFDKLFGQFAAIDMSEVQTVVARSGLHAARLAAINNKVRLAIQRYGDRLGPWGEYLPPVELRGFIADCRRLREELRAQAEDVPRFAFGPRPAGASNILEFPVPEAVRLAESARAAVAMPAAGAAPLTVQPAVEDVPVQATVEVRAPAPVEEPRPAVFEPVAPVAAPEAAAPEVEAFAPVRHDTTENADPDANPELAARLTALEASLTARLTELRGEVGNLAGTLDGVTAAIASIQSRLPDLRNELQDDHVQTAQTIAIHLEAMREDLRHGFGDAHADLLALAGEQRAARNYVLIAVLVCAAATVAAVIAAA